jgi:hypothetical protein
MTKLTIELKVTPDLVRWANNPAWPDGHITITDGAIVLQGTVHTLRQAFNTIAQMGLIDTPKMERVVFAAYDPNGDRHQITSKNLVYSYCVAYREDGELELARAMELYGTPECLKDEYEAYLVDLESDKQGWAYIIAKKYLGESKSLQEYFEKEYAERVVPLQEKIKAGGFDKYIVSTSSWKFMREEAEQRADQYRLWGNRRDITILEGRRE